MNFHNPYAMRPGENPYGNWAGTTILAVRKGDDVVVAGDGQVSFGQTVMKSNARKVRRLYNGNVLAGFAGGTADAFTLFEKFEIEPVKPVGDKADKKIVEKNRKISCECFSIF